MLTDNNLRTTYTALTDKFEHISEKFPSKIATRFANNSLNYKMLNEKANQLAHYLVDLGITKGELVGISLDRNHSLIISILAILKTGAAYVPMDPSNPKERIDYMIEDSEVKLHITDSNNLDNFVNAEILILNIDEEHKWNNKSHENLNLDIKDDSLAYIIYTSGSTGKPKGVKVTHKNVLRLFSSTHEFYNFSEDHVWTLFHSYSFDFSVWEIWGALLYGAKLVIVPYLISRSPNEFYELIINEKVTVLNQTPTAFLQLQRFVNEEKSRSLEHNLRYIIFGGEKLNISSLKEWMTNNPTTKMINMYGITETTVHTTIKELSIEDTENGVNSIGAPIKDLKVYIVDKNLRPLPKGMTGEIIVGGPGVANGYLNLPELTSKKFINHPAKQTEKLYRSGDLGRYLENGEIEYIGRNDNQVKLRGFRIELDEIEKQIFTLTGIEDVVVSVEPIREDDEHIVAYIKTNESFVADVKYKLKEKLPIYMIPSYVIFIDEIPLTINGKTDFKKLIDIREQTQKNTFSTERIPPNTAIEKILFNVWKEKLNHDSFGIHDSFFDVGGHSLLVSKMLWDIKEKFHVDIPIKVIFKEPTIEKISDFIEESTKNKKSDHSNRISLRSNNTQYPMTYAQQGIWFQDQFFGSNSSYNMILPLEIKGQLDVNALEQSISLVVLKHDTLRSNFYNDQGIAIQKVKGNSKIDFSIQDIKEQEITDWISLYSKELFDLENDSMLRTRLLKVNKEKFILIFVLHHIIGDAQSLKNLLMETSNNYNKITSNKKLENNNLDIQYADFAEWQNNFIKSKEVLKQIDFWDKELDGVSNYLDLVSDVARDSKKHSEGDSIKFEFSYEQTLMIRQICNENRITPYMWFMATWSLMMKKITGQNDIVIGSNISNRHPETENLIGIFINTLPVRTKFESVKKLSDLLKTTKDTVVNALSNQDVPFEYLMSKLKIKREQNRSVLCQVFLSYQPYQNFNGLLEGLEVSQLDDQVPSVTFDLALEIFDAKDHLKGELQYNQSIFTSQSMNHLLLNYFELLEKLLSNKEINLEEI